MRLKEIVSNWYIVNNGSRSLFESVVVPEVEKAIKDWAKNSKPNYVLIGGLALAYHHIPRMTMDVDVLYLTKESMPSASEVPGFKQVRDHAFLHKQTHVEVETLTPDFIKVSQQLIQAVFDTAINEKGVKIASKSGLIALKLTAHRTGAKGRQDQVDIINLISIGNIDLSPFHLSSQDIELYNQLAEEVD